MSSEPHPAADSALPLADALAQRSAQVQRQVEDERVATVYALTASPVFAGMAFSVLVAVILWPYRPAALVLAWLALKMASAFLRLNDVRRFNLTPLSERRMAYWKQRSVALNSRSTASAGARWASSSCPKACMACRA